MDEHTIGASVRIDPTGEREGSFYEKELAVGIPNSDYQIRNGLGGEEEEGDDEPLVGDGVGEVRLAMEVGKGRGVAEGAGRGEGGGKGEVERVSVEEVRGEVGGEEGVELEVERGKAGESGGGGERRRERGVDGVEESVLGGLAAERWKGAGG